MLEFLQPSTEFSLPKITDFGTPGLFAVIRAVVSAARAAPLIFAIVVPIVAQEPTDQGFQHGALLHTLEIRNNMIR